MKMQINCFQRMMGGLTMRRMNPGVLAVALLVSGAAAADAQVRDSRIQRENTGVGTASGEFLLLGAGARGMALGPSVAAYTRDIDALYYNPANLPLMEGRQVGLTVMPYFADTRYMWMGVAVPIAGGDYAIGFSLANFGFSDQPQYTEEDPDGEGGLTYGVSETVFGVSFAHAFIDRFTGGATLKFINDRLGQTSAFGFVMDVGTNYHAELGGRPIAFSFTIQNLDVLGIGLKHSGPGLGVDVDPISDDPTTPGNVGVDPARGQVEATEFPIPVVYRVGLAYDIMSAADRRLTLLTDFNEPYQTKPGFSIGGELAWTPADMPIGAALRGSYAYQGDNDFDERRGDPFDAQVDADKSGMDGINAGAGLSYKLSNYQLRLDYAFRHFGVLGTRNAFTFALSW
jgi:hypothetical protein